MLLPMHACDIFKDTLEYHGALRRSFVNGAHCVIWTVKGCMLAHSILSQTVLWLVCAKVENDSDISNSLIGGSAACVSYLSKCTAKWLFVWDSMTSV